MNVADDRRVEGVTALPVELGRSTRGLRGPHEDRTETSKTQSPDFGALCGAGDGVRTRDIQLGKLTLYQLSYSRTGRIS